MGIDIENMLKNAIEKHKERLLKPIVDSDGEEEDISDQINRLSNILYELKSINGIDTPLKLLDDYFERVCSRNRPLNNTTIFEKALKNLKEERGSNTTIEHFCSQPIETIIDQYAELFAYHKVLDELHRNQNPNFYRTKEEEESKNTSNNQTQQKTEFHLKKHLDKKYPNLLKKFHDEFKKCFVEETLPLWLKRFNNLDEKPIKEIEFVENKLYNKKALLAILITIHELVKNKIVFNDFVIRRFGFKYKSSKKNNSKVFDINNPSSLYSKCQAILRSINEKQNA